ncbi:hypothetical protein L2E82_22254 [Cichorium intybus]|uniref:Uncharacterized protein n=1 Tax=Cichorium intybus TaxID=13427 RepID=A0ACB9DXL8_CICIN|nr:hypothetical protein L2E82_22254 [Cichorium intybus]
MMQTLEDMLELCITDLGGRQEDCPFRVESVDNNSFRTSFLMTRIMHSMEYRVARRFTRLKLGKSRWLDPRLWYKLKRKLDEYEKNLKMAKKHIKIGVSGPASSRRDAALTLGATRGEDSCVVESTEMISRESTIDKNGAVSQILKRQYRISRTWCGLLAMILLQEHGAAFWL